jgi:hypothetical protein
MADALSSDKLAREIRRIYKSSPAHADSAIETYLNDRRKRLPKMTKNRF